MPNTGIEDPLAREEADFVALENELNGMEAEVTLPTIAKMPRSASLETSCIFLVSQVVLYP